MKEPYTMSSVFKISFWKRVKFLFSGKVGLTISYEEGKVSSEINIVDINLTIGTRPVRHTCL